MRAVNNVCLLFLALCSSKPYAGYGKFSQSSFENEDKGESRCRLLKWITGLKALHKVPPPVPAEAAGKHKRAAGALTGTRWHLPTAGAAAFPSQRPRLDSPGATRTARGWESSEDLDSTAGRSWGLGQLASPRPSADSLPGQREGVRADARGPDSTRGTRHPVRREREGAGAAKTQTSASRHSRGRVGPGRQPGLAQHQRPLPLPLDARPHRGRQLGRLFCSRRLRGRPLDRRHLPVPRTLSLALRTRR